MSRTLRRRIFTQVRRVLCTSFAHHRRASAPLICTLSLTTLRFSRPHQSQALSFWRCSVFRCVDSCIVRFHQEVVHLHCLFTFPFRSYVTGNNSETLMLPAGLPFASVGGSSFGNEPNTFAALLGFFSFGGEDLVGSEAASGRQACLVHNQRTNFPALFTIGISSGFYVTEYSSKSRTEVSVREAFVLCHPSLESTVCRLFFLTMLLIWKVCRCSIWRQFHCS
jgi:hypothetical protein